MIFELLSTLGLYLFISWVSTWKKKQSNETKYPLAKNNIDIYLQKFSQRESGDSV